ncbi:hypothetical protein LINGRAHAP2_LOCUS8853 [Linum grandiflorum]
MCTNISFLSVYPCLHLHVVHQNFATCSLFFANFTLKPQFISIKQHIKTMEATGDTIRAMLQCLHKNEDLTGIRMET